MLASDRGRAHPRAQHLGKQADRVDLLDARELQHVVAHQPVKVLPAPALGLVVVGGQAGFGKAATLQQMVQSVLGCGPGLLTPFAHRERVQPQAKEPARQGFAALPESVHAGAARHQQLLAGGFAVVHAFEPGFRVGHFVDFIQHQQRRLRVPALVEDQGPIGRNVVVEVLPTLLRNQLAAESGFTHLARTGEEHHFLGQVGLHTVVEVAFHVAILRLF